LGSHFNLIVEADNSSHALTAIDAKLPFVERAHAPPNGHNTFV
jgi:hypothetical protein